MPTYDYRCKACDHEFELVQKMSAPVKKKCPSCRKLQLERLIGIGAGFIIKGGSASVQAEEAEKAKDKKDRKASAKLTETTSTDSKASDSKKPKDSKGDTQPKSSPKGTSDSSAKPEKKPEPEKNEKKLSGSTSTPTHKAREGRGVGNLVDKAKRRTQEASKKKPMKKTKKK
jgi:putative FmdB family regulatory protein